jgi:hypothetical protein
VPVEPHATQTLERIVLGYERCERVPRIQVGVTDWIAGTPSEWSSRQTARRRYRVADRTLTLGAPRGDACRYFGLPLPANLDGTEGPLWGGTSPGGQQVVGKPAIPPARNLSAEVLTMKGPGELALSGADIEIHRRAVTPCHHRTRAKIRGGGGKNGAGPNIGGSGNDRWNSIDS